MSYKKGDLNLLAPEPTDGHGENLVHLSAEYTNMLKAHQSTGVAEHNLPPITFGWLADTSLNGEACYIEDAPYSTLNQGILIFAAPYFRCLLSNPSCLPQIGNPGKEKLGLGYPSWEALRSITQTGFSVSNRKINEVFTSIQPQCPMRAEYANILTMLICDFVAFHEAWHHLAGHVGYAEHLSRPIHLRETSNSFPNSSDVMLYQACEMDADSRAAETMAASLWLSLKRSSGPIFDIFKDDLESAMAAWVFAQTTLYLVWFGGLDANSWTASLMSTHPHPALRMVFCLGIGLAKLNMLDQKFTRKADSAKAAVQAAAQASGSTFLSAMTIQPLTNEWFEQCAERYGQILQALMILQPEFTRHAYWRKPASFVDEKHFAKAMQGK